MKTIRTWLIETEKKAVAAGKEASAIKLLMQHVAQKESYEIVSSLDEALSAEQAAHFEAQARKYIEDNVPMQHLIGHEVFLGYAFKVNADVLIPRLETEELVTKVLDLYDAHFDGQSVDVIDIGTGCGAIGISLALEEPGMDVTLTDISEAALDVAKHNAKALGANVAFLQSDMLDAVIQTNKKFDILVSNPPYIPEKEEVDALVYDNEPHLALFGGADGLYFYRKILQDAAQILKTPNVIAFEHAYHHREGMAKLIPEFFPDAQFETFKDMQGKDRITVIWNH